MIASQIPQGPLTKPITVRHEGRIFTITRRHRTKPGLVQVTYESDTGVGMTTFDDTHRLDVVDIKEPHE